MAVNPGVVGWFAVGAVVALADGVALKSGRPTMSDEFSKHYGWAVAVTGGVVAHLLMHNRTVHHT